MNMNTIVTFTVLLSLETNKSMSSFALFWWKQEVQRIEFTNTSVEERLI